MSDQWFVNSNGEQTGPYSGEQLVQYAREGLITAETMVWAEGMAEWAAASQIEGLLPEAAVEVAASPAPAAWRPPGAPAPLAGAAPAASQIPQAEGGAYPFFPVKAVSFSLWMWSFLGGFILFILAIVGFSMGAKSAIDAQAAGAGQDAMTAAATGKFAFGMVLMGLGGLSLLLSMVFSLINIHRAWGCLRAGNPATSPGKAVGFLFIPFFNIYWIFVALAGLPKDWNRIVASYDDLKAAPRLSEGVFLMYCIGSLVFPPLALIVGFPMMAQICRGVNFFAFRRNPNAPSALGAKGFGGVKFN
ncbi:DUF4339 domain-containing protein [Akkermansiaceae bacterium]|nr:DUF4339 domain-containing protein [Akkermansiaceae bacterium]